MMREPAHLLEALRAARELIASPLRWTPVNYAVDGEGKWVPAASKNAVRFSLLGAVVRGGRGAARILSSTRRALHWAAPDLYERLGAGGLSHADSLALLDATLQRLEAAERTPSGSLLVATERSPSTDAAPEST